MCYRNVTNEIYKASQFWIEISLLFNNRKNKTMTCDIKYRLIKNVLSNAVFKY